LQRWDLTYKEASEFFSVDSNSPSGIVWKQDRRGGRGLGRIVARKGSVAGSRSSKGYWRVSLCGKLYTTSRIVVLLVDGELSLDEYVDHIDGNPDNNMHSNLRKVSPKLNARNQKFRISNKTGVKGVHFQTARGTHGYFVASCVDLKGDLRKWHYSVVKLGAEEALRRATAKREEELRNLNLQGAGYTERHMNDFD